MIAARHVLCTNGVKSVLLELIPAFERARDAKLAVTWGSTQALLKDLETGAGGEIGIQQLSELLPVAGIDIVGPLPSPLQKITIFSGGVLTAAKEASSAAALLAFLAAEFPRLLNAKGLEPA